MSAAPQTIPFNIIDRSYLITESDEANAQHFPMSLIAAIKLKEGVSHSQLVAAFQSLARKYPQLRLAYQLDYQAVCWRRIADEALDKHLAACVHELPDNCPIEGQIGELIAENNTELSQPVNLFIAGDYLLLRWHHSFGDGKFLFLMLYLLVCELSGRKGSGFQFANVWWKPSWRVSWENPLQGSLIMGRFVKSLFSSYQDYKQDTQDKAEKKRSPIVHGSPMAVRCRVISAENMAILNKAKGDFSLNTLLQVMIGDQLQRLKIQEEAVTYTVSVDLRRYLRDAESYYPSNLASQVRIRIAEGTFPERCAALQKQLTEDLQKGMPLVNVPGEWLLALGGKKTYQAVNRDWLLKSTENDPRRFVMSNVGKLDALFAGVADLLAEDFAPQIAIPLMGGPTLVFCFNSFRQQGTITLSYDAQVFSSAQIDEIMCLFDTEQIEHVAQQLSNQ
jgi:NRPS condensation-like uncharacterized protein